MIHYSKFCRKKNFSIEVFHTWHNFSSQQEHILCYKKPHWKTLLKGLCLGLLSDFFMLQSRYTGHNRKKMYTCRLEFIQHLNLRFTLAILLRRPSKTANFSNSKLFQVCLNSKVWRPSTNSKFCCLFGKSVVRCMRSFPGGLVTTGKVI